MRAEFADSERELGGYFTIACAAKSSRGKLGGMATNNYFIVATPKGHVFESFDDASEKAARMAYAVADRAHQNSRLAMGFTPHISVFRPLAYPLPIKMGVVGMLTCVEHGPDPDVAGAMCLRCTCCGVRTVVRGDAHARQGIATSFESRHAACARARDASLSARRVREEKRTAALEAEDALKDEDAA